MYEFFDYKSNLLKFNKKSPLLSYEFQSKAKCVFMP
jgi:hypothetical protein